MLETLYSSKYQSVTILEIRQSAAKTLLIKSKVQRLSKVYLRRNI
nr:MAG TPA: hypothetical protein [Caudoviricetes sp.]